MGPSEYLPVLPICLRTVSVDLSIYLSACLFVHPFIHLHLPILLPDYLFIY